MPTEEQQNTEFVTVTEINPRLQHQTIIKRCYWKKNEAGFMIKHHYEVGKA
jgi:hypothetical protein